MEPAPLPPEQLRERVATKDGHHFDQSGAATVDEWARALASVGKTFSDFRTIVDFGCGCGRAIRHLRTKINPASQTLIGMDPDTEAIQWIERNFGDVRAYVLNESPPAPLADDSVDLIVSHSVFTHLPEGVQHAWLGELRRILRPGGIAVTTFHGEFAFRVYISSLKDAGHAGLAESLPAEFKRSGFVYMEGRTSAESPLPAYYGSTFHDVKYVSDNWSSYFTILAWFPRFALNLQDTLVLRKPEA